MLLRGKEGDAAQHAATTRRHDDYRSGRRWIYAGALEADVPNGERTRP
jgi:hypothetical protein